MEKETTMKTPKAPTVWQSLISFGALVAVMSVGIAYFHVDPHVPMFIGVIVAALVSLSLGYKWSQIEEMMISGISKAMQAILILCIVGMMIGVWLLSGTIPTMIYYGLKLLSPSIFLVAALLICSITSLATGTSWGTAGTMGLALMGIAHGLGMPPGPTAGAILSGAYFGDKLSPLSDTTNLAPAMAGTDVFTHVKYMMKSTIVAYSIALIFFGVYGFTHASGGNVDTSQAEILANGLKDTFNINPLLLIPPIVVIGAIALKIPAIPGITLGLITGAAGAYLPEAVPVDVHPPQTHSGLPRPERGTVVDFPCADRHHPDRLYHAVNPVITFHCFSLLFTPSYKTRSNRHLRILYYQFTGLRRTFKPCPRFGPEQDKKIPRQAKLPDRRLLRFTSGSAQAELYGPVPRRASLRLISDPVPAEHQSPLLHIFHPFCAASHTLSAGTQSVRSPTGNRPPPRTQYHYTVFPRAVTALASSSSCFAFCLLSFLLPMSHGPAMYIPDAANRNLSYLLLSGYSRQYADTPVTAIPRHVSSCACTMTIPQRVYSCVR